jgi:RHS repeat-associated protein
VTAVRSFDPWGVPLFGDGGAPFGYAGEIWDAQAELTWLRARWLSEGQGRFFQPDRFPGDPERPITLNPYIYAAADPLRYIDPSGNDFAPPQPLPLPWPTLQQLMDAAASVGPFAAAGAPEGAVVAGTVVGCGGWVYYGSMWAIQDSGPDYPLPEAFTPGAISATYPLPGISTIRIPTTAPLGQSISDVFVQYRCKGDKRTAGQIIGEEKKGSINQRFPGELKGKTPDEINEIKHGKGPLAEKATTAQKLLGDHRFDKDQKKGGKE